VTDVDAAITAGEDFPSVQWLIILLNENADCTSAMICKDGIKVQVD
jgi:hypothetical protein